jgi:hypothetical protein
MPHVTTTSNGPSPKASASWFAKARTLSMRSDPVAKSFTIVTTLVPFVGT